MDIQKHFELQDWCKRRFAESLTIFKIDKMFKEGEGILGMVVLAQKTRAHPGAKITTKSFSKDRKEAFSCDNTMSTTGEATANRSGSWQAAVNAELRKPPSDETEKEVWKLRSKEATAASLQGECSVK
jgi:hypothetical protein